MGITLTPRTRTVILLQGDDIEQQEELLAAVENAARQVSRRSIAERRMADDADVDPVAEAGRAYDEFMDGAIARAAKVRMCALPKGEWRDLVADHLPREGDDRDQAYGFNVATCSDPAVKACIAGGQFDSDGERDGFVDGLSDGQFTQLFDAAVDLNQGVGPDPKARLSSPPDPTSGETSESPGRLG